MENTKFFLDKFATLEDSEKEEFLSGVPHHKYKEETLDVYNYFKSIGKKVVFIEIDTPVDETLKLDIEEFANFRPSVTENKLIVITLPTLEDLKERDEKSTKIIKINNMTIETFPITSLPNKLLQRRDILDRFVLYEKSVKTFPKIREYIKNYSGYLSMKSKSESQEIIKEKNQLYFYYGLQSIILGVVKDFIDNL